MAREERDRSTSDLAVDIPFQERTFPALGSAVETAAVTSILVMDDDEMIRDLAALTLAHFGYKVVTCANGSDAIALYNSSRETGTPFSVVIMDLTIPGGMGGVEAARRLLAIDPAANLIVSSGYSEDPVMANCGEYGFCAAIEKPYKAADVARVLTAVQKKSP